MDLDNLPEPDDLAEEIIDNLEAGLAASARCSPNCSDPGKGTK